MTTETSKPSFRRRTILATALAGALLAAGIATTSLADTSPVDVQVVDRESGRPLKVWRHHGRMFVAGDPGSRYGLRVTNHTGGRVLVVLSVDGVNVVSGETAGYDQRGYVFAPYETYDVNGWRKSNDEIAGFAFAPLPQSYAARTGRPGDVGVIGMAVFKEKQVPRPRIEPQAQTDQPSWRDRARGAFGGLGAAAPMAAPPPAAMRPPAESESRAANDAVVAQKAEKLGTAHGAREWDTVTLTEFERATTYPTTVRQIEYDTYANLVSAGVIPTWRAEEHHPRPFPAYPDDGGYVPDPPQP